AFGEQKPQQTLERLGVGRIPEKRALTFHVDHMLSFQAVEMMRECGRRDVERRTDLAGDHAGRVGSEQEANDAKSRLGAHRREHVGQLSGLPLGRRGHDPSISTFPQISKYWGLVYSPACFRGTFGVPDEEFRDSSGLIVWRVSYDSWGS